MLALALALLAVEPAPAAAAPVPPPAVVAPAMDLAGFAALPEDPPPKEIIRGQHYYVSNEERPETFRDELLKAGPGGVYVGVGAEQNYVFAGWAKPDVMVLMDFDGGVPDLHRMFASVFKRAETKEAFVEMFSLQKQKDLVAAIRADYPEPKVRLRIFEVMNEARGNVRVHAERIRKGFDARGVHTYLNDDALYGFIRKLFLDGRVFFVRGDLTARKTMQAIGDASKRAHLMVHAIYLSNAEQYFSFGESFRDNVLAQPFDERSRIFRTISWSRYGFVKDSNDYHYNTQGGLSFQSWVVDKKTTGVAVVLEAAERKDGISHLFTPPGTAPEVPEPAVDGAPIPIAPIAGAAPVAPVPAMAKVTTSSASPSLVPLVPLVPLEKAPAVVPCPGALPARMRCVAGGAFLRGTNDKLKLAQNARPQSTVWVQTMLMDTYEVTVAEYKACIAAGKCGKAGPNYSDFSAPKQPITGVNWFNAREYCAAQGKRLPTEAEWEHAARGADGRTFPWGNQPATCERAVIQIDAGRSCGIQQNSADHPDTGRPEAVGSKPASLYGLYDMAGNVSEWVADWFSPSWAECGDACAGVDPKGPCGGADVCPGHDERVVRGGSWYWPGNLATSWHRRPHTPSNSPVFHHFGFRCAADVGQVQKSGG